MFEDRTEHLADRETDAVTKHTAARRIVARMTSSGSRLLSDRYLNKGTAFSIEERDRLGLHGLLPPVVEDLHTQLRRIRTEYDAKRSDLGRHIFLRSLQERNSVAFYAFAAMYLDEVLPIVYTPTVGLACQEWSSTYRREHGLIMSWPNRHIVPQMLDNLVGDAEVDVVVVTDGERILGLGDLGAGGMGIPIGKLALYTMAGGLDPARTLPVILDVGTDNENLLSDPLYLGWRHHRIRGEQYDELVDLFVDALNKRFPGVLLQWEDFAQSNANRLLSRHRDAICSFNDDIQGTAAVTVAAIASGLGNAGVPLRDLRLVVAGAGSAGTGIAGQAARALMSAGLSEADAYERCWLVDRDGLLNDNMKGLQSFQQPFAHKWVDVAHLDNNSDGKITLAEVVRHVAPHALVGVTGQPGLFTEEVIRAVAAGVDRPVVLPLSNPTVRAEAIPADVFKWSDGRAQVGTGSPFDPVTLNGAIHHTSQVNNIYIFPGVGLGVVACRARRVSDSMFTAAATAIGELDRGEHEPGDASLLPPVSDSRKVSRHVAIAVAECAIDEGLADSMTRAELETRIDEIVWEPVYGSAVDR